MHIRLFERPSPSHNRLASTLDIEGTLPPAAVSSSYEGRLEIVNPIGDCTAELVSGTLPPGASLSVDNSTKQVVVTWPAYRPEVVPIVNYGFEAGDVGWERGPGWFRTDDNAVEGDFCMKFVDHGGSSLLVNSVRASVAPDTPITGSCWVRQGASSAGNAGACVRLQFYDSAGNELEPAEGNIISQGSNNEAKLSSVSASAPKGAAEVAIACRGFRKRQNREVWVDGFTWDVKQPSVGTDQTGEWCITLEVRDSGGRSARWSGCVSVVGEGIFYLATTSRIEGRVKILKATPGAAWSSGSFILGPSVPLPQLDRMFMANNVLYYWRAVNIPYALFRSSDFGETWDEVLSYSREVNGPTELVEIQMPGGWTRLILVLTGGAAPVPYLRSDDNGLTWSEMDYGTAPDRTEAEGFCIFGDALLVGHADSFDATTNGGESWTRYGPPGPFRFGGMVATPTNIIVPTADIFGWRRFQTARELEGPWTIRDQPYQNTAMTPQVLGGAYNPNTKCVLWVLKPSGSTQRCVRSYDDGETWEGTPKLPSTLNVARVQPFGSSFLVWSENGTTVYRTDDDGETWQEALSGLDRFSGGDMARTSALPPASDGMWTD